MGFLTTHVLDTAQGCPASNVSIQLYSLEGKAEPVLLKQALTNEDGRTDQPLLKGDDFQVGLYELRFDVLSYFRSQGFDLPEPPFLDVVPLRFGIADAADHYHVPLLVSPWSFSTYRGS